MAEHNAQLDLVCLRNAIRNNDKAICSEIEQRYGHIYPRRANFQPHSTHIPKGKTAGPQIYYQLMFQRNEYQYK